MKKNFLKTLLFSTLLAVSSFFAACDEETGIIIGIPQTQIQLFGIDGAGNLVIDTVRSVPSNLDSVLATQEATREDIESIILDSVKLFLTDSLGNTLSTANFSSIKAMAIKVAKVGAGQLYTDVAVADSAHMASINTNNPILLPLPNAGFDFLPYVAEPQFNVKMVGALNNQIQGKFYIKSEISLKVNVKF